MLEPFGRRSTERAIMLLRRGFPDRTESYWRDGFEAVSERAQGDHPLGFILRRSQQDAGVILTFASNRGGEGGPVVNLSSWYVDPDSRQLASLMLKSVIRAAGTYTDFTPTRQVEAINRMLGFERQVDERGLVFLPVTPRRHEPGATLENFDPAGDYKLDQYSLTMLADHASLGCRALVLKEAGTDWPIVLRTRSVRGLSIAELVYAEVGPTLRNISLFKRYLIRRGIALLAWEYLSDAPPDLPIVHRRPQPRYVKRTAQASLQPGRIDFTYSELIYLEAKVRPNLSSRAQKIALPLTGAIVMTDGVPWAI
jgi:hypothetical protein